MMMFSINPAFDMLPSKASIFDCLDHGFQSEALQGIDPMRAELYKRCTQKQVGITVMKTFGGGKLLSAEHTPYSKPMTSAQCVHYALSRPAVASVLTGCKTRAEMMDTMKYLTADDMDKDYSWIFNEMHTTFEGNCVYCGHCQPCPSEIDIAAVNKYLDIARLDKEQVPPSIRSHYQSLLHGGGECIACGSCEERCPFGVPVIENMMEAEQLLGKRV